MRTTNLILIIGLLSVLWLGGCATPYQPKGMTGGFGEKKISDSAYWVYFSGNGYAKRDRVVNFWIYRCAELTTQNGFQYMVIRPGENAPVGLQDGQDIKPAVYSPDGRERLMAVKGGGSSGGTYTYIPGGGGTITTWSSKGTVLMYKAPLPEELVWALDAQKVMALLGPYVTSDGSSPAPDWNTLFKSAMVAHEQITVAVDPFPVTAENVAKRPESSQTGKSDTPVQPVGKLRSESDIRKKFEEESVRYHALFRERKRLENRNDAGSVVLSFVVTPNGIVTKCRVVSTTFERSQFPQALATAACRVTFPPQNVDASLVSAFPIKFTPSD